ncbi:MAG: hypothetical protein ACRCTG_14490 [Aestuariivirga sp.]
MRKLLIIRRHSRASIAWDGIASLIMIGCLIFGVISNSAPIAMLAVLVAMLCILVDIIMRQRDKLMTIEEARAFLDSIDAEER